jgi:hypothetical protein
MNPEQALVPQRALSLGLVLSLPKPFLIVFCSLSLLKKNQSGNAIPIAVFCS